MLLCAENRGRGPVQIAPVGRRLFGKILKPLPCVPGGAKETVVRFLDVRPCQVLECPARRRQDAGLGADQMDRRREKTEWGVHGLRLTNRIVMSQDRCWTKRV